MRYKRRINCGCEIHQWEASLAPFMGQWKWTLRGPDFVAKGRSRQRVTAEMGPRGVMLGVGVPYGVEVTGRRYDEGFYV